MRNEHYSETLFQTQRQLHERLGFLVEFDSNIVLLKGATGCGKSHLLLAFLSAQVDESINHALINCQPQNECAFYRHQILTQLIPNPLFDEADSLVESLSRMLPEQGQRMLLVLDDANVLPEQIWGELVELIELLRRQELHQLSVIAAVDRVASLPLTLTRSSILVEVAVPPLSITERRDFLTLQLASERDSMLLNTEAIERKLSAAKTPAAVILLAENIRGGRLGKSKFPWQHALLAAMIALLLVCLLLWEFNDSAPSGSHMPAEEISVAGPVISTPPETESMLPQQDTDVAAPLLNADELLPNVIDTPPLELKTADRPAQSVVVEIPDELLEEAAEEDLIPSASALPGASEPLDMADPDTASAAVATADAPAADIRAVPSVSESTPTLTDTKGDEIVRQLKSWPAEHFTLQLGVFADDAVLQRFYQRSELQALKADLLEYPVLRSGTTRHVVILGNFVNREAATSFLSNQPASVQALKPWIKSLAAVHQDLMTVSKELTPGE